MTESNSLYRRHRPHSFAEVVGQQHVVRTLSNAITEDKIHHAYLFVGSRGTGKTSMAKILAASLNCAEGGPTLTPCGRCESCRSIAAGTSVDVIEMDAASNRSVDDIRELRERVAFAPAAGHWKVYILDEAHMLTKEAWNAFLKTLEEPPPNTVFILATTEAHKVMPTIADRCQRFDFHRPSVEELSEVVNRVATAEGITIEAPAVSMIARSASGSFRDALGTLDQLASYSGTEVGLEDVLELLGAADADLVFGTVDAVVAGDPKAVLESVDAVIRSGRDPARFARDMLGHLRMLLLTRMTGEIPDAFSVTAADPARLQAQAAAIGPAHLVQTIDELAESLGAIRGGDEARLAVEVALLKAARPDLDPGIEGLIRRIERLEAGGGPEIGGGAPASAPGRRAAPTRDPDSGTGKSPEPADAGPAEEPEASDPQQATPAGQSNPPESPGTPETADPTTGDPVEVHAGEAADRDEGGSEVISEIHQIVQVWPAVMDAIRAGDSGPTASYFEGTRPVSIDGEGLVVGFPPDAGFNRRNAEKPERMSQLIDAIESVTGSRPEVTYTELETDHTSESDPSGKKTMNEQEFIDRIKSEFNAEEVI